MAQYTYTIYDANPMQANGMAWPSHEDIEIEADSDEEVMDDVRDVMSVEAAGLKTGDGYDVGQTLYALIHDVESDTLLDIVTYEITAEDLSVDQDDS
jgi:hypothetical protein